MRTCRASSTTLPRGLLAAQRSEEFRAACGGNFDDDPFPAGLLKADHVRGCGQARLRARLRNKVRCSIKGRPYTNFQRALKTGDLLLIRAAAAELPIINLQDALDICLVVAEQEPELFERAALRWLARYCLERRDANLAGLRQAADAFSRLQIERATALAVLRRLCSQ